MGFQLRIDISARFSVHFQFRAEVKKVTSRAEPSWKSFNSSYGSSQLGSGSSLILVIHKARILWKKPLKKTFLAFKNGVKSIQTAGYNGARTVYKMYFIFIEHWVSNLKP